MSPVYGDKADQAEAAKVQAALREIGVDLELVMPDSTPIALKRARPSRFLKATLNPLRRDRHGRSGD